MDKIYQQNYSNHFLTLYSQNYKQLWLPIKSNIRNSRTYQKSAYGFCSLDEIEEIAKSENITLKLDFSFSEKDWLKTYTTPQGDVDILYFSQRDDFVHAVNSLGNYCEPKDYPLTMKSVCITGIYNWPKINEYLDKSMIRPLAIEEINENIKDYLTSLIIVGDGPYSNIPSEVLSFDEDYWLSKSLTIRIYHELCHFIRNSLNIESKDQIFEEVLADACGLISAFENYDTNFAKIFLGIKKGRYKDGGRLENYVHNKTEIQDIADEANVYIESLSFLIKDNANMQFISSLKKESVIGIDGTN